MKNRIGRKEDRKEGLGGKKANKKKIQGKEKKRRRREKERQSYM